MYNEVNELDWTHSNSIFYDPISESVYVSLRNLSRITSIDYSTGQINWNLGESDFMDNPSFQNELNFSQQHSAQLTPSGNLFFFDNLMQLQKFHVEKNQSQVRLLLHPIHLF